MIYPYVFRPMKRGRDRIDTTYRGFWKDIAGTVSMDAVDKDKLGAGHGRQQRQQRQQQSGE